MGPLDILYLLRRTDINSCHLSGQRQHTSGVGYVPLVFPMKDDSCI